MIDFNTQTDMLDDLELVSIISDDSVIGIDDVLSATSTKDESVQTLVILTDMVNYVDRYGVTKALKDIFVDELSKISDSDNNDDVIINDIHAALGECITMVKRNKKTLVKQLTTFRDAARKSNKLLLAHVTKLLSTRESNSCDNVLLPSQNAISVLCTGAPYGNFSCELKVTNSVVIKSDLDSISKAITNLENNCDSIAVKQYGEIITDINTTLVSIIKNI